MTWQRLPVAFELQSPLHIGFLPSQPGTVVARTRCYVPGKNLWGAVVANLTPHLFPSLSPRAFRKVGHAVRNVIRFSYLYPCFREMVLAPDYAMGELRWGELPDREFRSQYVGAYVSTSIAPNGGAEHGTLHEIEFLRDQTGRSIGRAERVRLAGTIWVKEGAEIEGKHLEVRDQSVWIDGRDILQGLTLGGERNYGFGLVRRVPLPEQLNAGISELWPQTDPDEAHPANRKALPGHLPYRPDLLFKGDVEVVAGREYPDQGDIPVFQRAGARVEIERNYWFVPGTRLESASDSGVLSVYLDSWGRLTWSD